MLYCYRTRDTLALIGILHQCRILFSKSARVLFQVRTNYRTAVTIPERSWVRFRDILTDFIDKVGGAKEGEASGGEAATGTGGSSSAATGGVNSTPAKAEGSSAAGGGGGGSK